MGGSLISAAKIREFPAGSKIITVQYSQAVGNMLEDRLHLLRRLFHHFLEILRTDDLNAGIFRFRNGGGGSQISVP